MGIFSFAALETKAYFPALKSAARSRSSRRRFYFLVLSLSAPVANRAGGFAAPAKSYRPDSQVIIRRISPGRSPAFRPCPGSQCWLWCAHIGGHQALAVVKTAALGKHPYNPNAPLHRHGNFGRAGGFAPHRTPCRAECPAHSQGCGRFRGSARLSSRQCPPPPLPRRLPHRKRPKVSLWRSSGAPLLGQPAPAPGAAVPPTRSPAYTITGSEEASPWFPLPAVMMTGRSQPPMRASEAAAAMARARVRRSAPPATASRFANVGPVGVFQPLPRNSG